MARTPLLGRVEEAMDGIAAERGEGTTRREIVKRATVAGIGLTALGRFAPIARGAIAPRVAIVGGGLAGLTSALRLKQAGINATVYEAATRPGGRCFTGRGVFGDGQIFERGGELIDNGHLAVKHLAQELGLDLDNLVQAEAAGTEMLAYFDGHPYSFAEMTDDLKVIWQQIHKDTTAASYPTTYKVSTPRGRELDRISVARWIELYVPGGLSSRLGQLLDIAYNIEYGAETTDQSSLNMLYLLGYVGPGQFRTFGKSNEKFHVRGGNDLLVSGMSTTQLGSQIQTGTELTAISLSSGGTYTLTFRVGSGTKTVVADHVVLALPFTLLRSVDWSKADFADVKARAIRELGMGTNSKLHLQFKARFWNDLGANGETYSDRGYQNTWEVSRAQAGQSGILVNYTGGTVGASFGSGSPSSRAKAFLGQLEPVLPGATAQWNGKAALDYWTGNQWTKGSYSYWKVGQYTSFSGSEGERSGNCHFAGEHTSQDSQGYLNGAVETGERAAAEILSDLK
jgi:monoamine oxidase